MKLEYYQELRAGAPQSPYQTQPDVPTHSNVQCCPCLGDSVKKGSCCYICTLPFAFCHIFCFIFFFRSLTICGFKLTEKNVYLSYIYVYSLSNKIHVCVTFNCRLNLMFSFVWNSEILCVTAKFVVTFTVTINNMFSLLWGDLPTLLTTISISIHSRV